MKPIRIFRHIACEGPGYLGQYLAQRKIPFTTVCIDRNEPIPRGLDDVSALVFMGGSMSVNDPLPWIETELHLIQQAQQRALPMLGHCLGGQLIAKALGGEVRPNPVKEIGWFEVTTTGTPAARQWFGQETDFMAFHWHGETFSTPTDADKLLRSVHCENQAFALGNTLALQCHMEMTEAMVAEWSSCYAEEIATPVSPTVQSAQQMLTDIKARVAALQAVATSLYGHWVNRLV